MCQELWSPNQGGRAWWGCSAGTLLPMARSGFTSHGETFQSSVHSTQYLCDCKEKPHLRECKKPIPCRQAQNSLVRFLKCDLLKEAYCSHMSTTRGHARYFRTGLSPPAASRNLVTPESLLKTIKCSNTVEKVQRLTYFETKEVNLLFKGHWSIFRKHLYI